MNNIKRQKRVLVLGGTGFHGRHVAAVAKKRGYKVYSISRREGTDIRNYPVFVKKLKQINPDAIIDCAGHEGSVHYVNQYAADVAHDTYQMALNIYRAVAEVCPKAVVINALGNCSYPGDATVAKESEWLAGPVHDSVLASGMEKRIKYVIAQSYFKQHGIKSINWIMSNCYGPGAGTDPNKLHAMNGIVIRMLKAKNNGDEKFSIWGTGTPIREWVYVGDAADILVRSINMPAQIYPVNFAQRKGYSIKQIAQIASKLIGHKVKFVFDTSKADGASVKILDNKEFKKKFPAYRFTPLQKGVAETIAYYKKLIK